MNNDFICREDLKEALANEIKTNDLGLWLKILLVIDNVPSVPLPNFKAGYKQAIIDGKTNYSRPKGEWVETSDFDEFYGKVYKCTNCNEETLGCDCHNYCPNCGADMRGNKKETTFDDYLKEQLKDPEFRKEWEKLSDEDM